MDVARIKPLVLETGKENGRVLQHQYSVPSVGRARMGGWLISIFVL